MRLALLLAITLAAPCVGIAQAEDTLSNGGFEELAPNGFAADWQPVWERVRITHDAHSGANAVLLDRDPKKPETGLNRDWQPGSGAQGKMLSARKGGIRFWYKVPYAPPDAHLRFYLIPMNAEPLEAVGGRQWYEVPSEHFGDGQWHPGLVAYDFTDNKNCRWVQVSPRLEATKPAQWILDDIQWVPAVGPQPAVTKVELREVKGREGREGIVSALVKNVGDQPLTAAASLDTPEGLACTESAQTAGPLAAGQSGRITWRVQGLRSPGSRIRVQVTGGALPASGSLQLAPRLDEVRLEASQFVLWPGKETDVRLVVVNGGTAAVRGVSATLQLPPEVTVVGRRRAALPVALPGVENSVRFRIRALRQTPSTRLVCSWRLADGRHGTASTELVIGAPAPRWGAFPRDAARIDCRTFTLVFPRNAFGYGIGWVYARPGGQLIGAVPRLGRIVSRRQPSRPLLLFASGFQRAARITPIGQPASAPAQGLTFEIAHPMLRRLGFPGPVQVAFAAPGPGISGYASHTITWQVRCAAPPAGTLLTLEGPLFCAGEGSFGSRQDEALFPGLEWLVRGEHSSSSLDIDRQHPHRLRVVPHPHMVTVPLMAVRHGSVCAGVFWHPRATWNDGRPRAGLPPDQSDTDRPCAIFASPNRFEGHASHLMGLSVPTVPAYRAANQRDGTRGWPAAGVRPRSIHLTAAFYVNPQADTALDAVRAWSSIYGLVAPRGLPHAGGGDLARLDAASAGFRGEGLPRWARSATRDGAWHEPAPEAWVKEIGWSAQGYLKTLWSEEEKGWYGSFGGPTGNEATPNPAYLYDCVMAARLTRDRALRQRLEQRISAVRSAHPGAVPQSAEFGFHFGRPVTGILEFADHAAARLRTQGPDGGWRFRARVETAGVFRGMDYAELGEDGAEAVGLTARDACVLLQVARMTGDRQMRDAGLKALRYMERFTIPRAAQVWEVPVHTPDILASADACEAYLEGYLLTGDRRWLRRAVYWAETGLPFLYQWDVDAFPWLRYGSIPVFGATWYQGSWFGRPVQWNGLVWAFSVLRLAEVDHTYPWRMLAAGVTISAMHQQGKGAKDLALWPDNIYALDGEKCPWIFAPQLILKNVYKLLGYEPLPRTALVRWKSAGAQSGVTAINACGRISGVRVSGANLSFQVDAPQPVPTRIVLFALARPERVTVNGRELPEREELGTGNVAGWRYYPGCAALEIGTGRAGRCAVVVAPAAYRRFAAVPEEVQTIAFEFDDDGGWRAANGLTPPDVADGCLVARATNSDPYLVRSNCRIPGSSVRRIRVRMAVSAGSGMEFYWTTLDSPAMAEDKTVKLPIQADGQMHEYVIDVGSHPLWQGHTITGLRLDPMSGATAADIRIDWVRGE